MFKPINFDSGKLVSLPLAVSQTVLKGYALAWASGYLAVATSSTEVVDYVAMEDVTTDGSSHTECLVLKVDGVKFEADCDAVASIADVGTYCDLATVATLNPDATDHDAFEIESIVGTAEVSKVVKGYFKRYAVNIGTS